MELGPKVPAMQYHLDPVGGHRLCYPRIVHYCSIRFIDLTGGDRLWEREGRGGLKWYMRS